MILLSLLVTFHHLNQDMLVPASIFSDGMVLQRNARVPIFGEANPGSKVVVQINGQSARGYANRSGHWEVRLNPLTAGGPYNLYISSEFQRVRRRVMVGEVWLCGGQSNMEWPVTNSARATALSSAANPNIRMFQVDRASSPTPRADATGTWTAANPDRVMRWSAVAYSFALEMYKRLKVPIGLIQTTWGGTKCESWFSSGALSTHELLRPVMETYQEQAGNYPVLMEEFVAYLARWKKEHLKVDPGNTGFGLGMADPNTSTQDWNSVSLPAAWEQIEGREVDGAVWYRKEIDLPASWNSNYVWLDLGQISDFDTTYVNNIQVGQTLKREVKRSYLVESNVFHPGKNTIAIRVWNQVGEGGMLGPVMRLRKFDRSATLNLEGQWKTKNELVIESPPSEELTKPKRPIGPGDPNAPGGLFNGMIAPLVPYAIRGVIWYQGESNLGEADRYRELFPEMIRDWREQWKQKSLPFFYVQLPGFGAPGREPIENPTWAEFRDAQTSALALPETGMAVTIDLGEPGSIHPTRKREVGERLAYMALEQVHGLKSFGACPVLKSHEYIGSKIRLRFVHVMSGFKTTDGQPIRGFEIAGVDGKWYPATCEPDGVFITVSSQSVTNPLSVRYAWANFPDTNLVNQVGLPVSRFKF